MHWRSFVHAAAAVGLLLLATAAGAQVTGSYTGELRLRHPPQTAAAAAVLTDENGALAGTVVLGGDDATVAGAYLVQGKRHGKRLRVKGVDAAGARLVFRARVRSDGIRGKARVRTAAGRVRARLALVRQPTGGGDSACGAVFAENRDFFTTDVMDGVLVPICAACHVPGGQAAATRLRVDAADPAATAESTTLLVDTTQPAHSLLLEKPLAHVPHGGGQRITEGSAEAQALAEWAALVAAADCTTPTEPQTGPELYAAYCASCHGPEGAGADGRPDVRCTVGSRLVDAIRRGRGTPETGMPAFTDAQLTDAQIDLVAEFLHGMCSGRGEDLYASNCATCHGASAGGGRNADGIAGPDIRCEDSFGEALAGGEGAMPAFPSLVGTSAGKIAAWVHTFCTGGGGGD